jgi:hypothetical protein
MQEVYNQKFETFQTIDFFDFNVLEHREKENEIDVFDIFGNTRLRTSWAR